MGGFRRFWEYMTAMIRRRLTKPLTPISIIAALATVLCFVVVGIWPVVRAQQKPILAWESWEAALELSWMAVLAAAYLKFSERIRLRHRYSRDKRRQLILRKLAASRAIVELHDNLAVKKTSTQDMRRVREALLECATISLQEQLALPEGEKLVATLLDFSSGDVGTMSVVARSSRARPVDVQYPSDRLVAWDAIRNGAIAIVDDIRDDGRWQAMGERSYRTVCAIPLTRAGKAYGALSMDSEMAFAFYGRSADIAIQVEPYLAVLVLTYPDESVSTECKYDPTHIR